MMRWPVNTIVRDQALAYAQQHSLAYVDYRAGVYDAYRVGLDAGGIFVPPPRVNAFMASLVALLFARWLKQEQYECLDATLPRMANVGLATLHARVPDSFVPYQTLPIGLVALPARDDTGVVRVPAHDVARRELALPLTCLHYLCWRWDDANADEMAIECVGHIERSALSALPVAHYPDSVCRVVPLTQLSDFMFFYARLVG